MPTIRVDFDDAKVPANDITEMSEAVRSIVQETTGIEDVFVYANASQIKVAIAPIEIFVQMSEQKIANFDELFDALSRRISAWKQERHFPHPINFTLIPMKWRFAIDI